MKAVIETDSKVSTYKRQKDTLPMEQGDTLAITSLILESSKSRAGRPAHYEDSPQGLDMFIQNSLSYFEYIQSCNIELEDKIVIADIESWAVYLGITRNSILNYERRSDQWKETIEYFKNAICSIKKQLALRGKIPSVVAVFNLANNHHYRNTSEFRLETEVKSDDRIALSADVLPRLERGDSD